MSILDGLRLQGIAPEVAWYNDALGDVAEALLNPTDEQVRQIISDPAFNEALMSWDRGHASQWGIVRAVLAAAAGGDDESL